MHFLGSYPIQWRNIYSSALDICLRYIQTAIFQRNSEFRIIFYEVYNLSRNSCQVNCLVPESKLILIFINVHHTSVHTLRCNFLFFHNMLVSLVSTLPCYQPGYFSVFFQNISDHDGLISQKFIVLYGNSLLKLWHGSVFSVNIRWPYPFITSETKLKYRK